MRLLRRRRSTPRRRSSCKEGSHLGHTSCGYCGVKERGKEGKERKEERKKCFDWNRRNPYIRVGYEGKSSPRTLNVVVVVAVVEVLFVVFISIS